MTALPPPPSTSAKQPSTYEFTKRKRWADLLLAELVEDVLFVLSPNCEILFCSAAVTELLGWRDVDILDLNFVEVIDSADQARFRVGFDECTKTNLGFHDLIQLKSNDSDHFYGNEPPSGALLFEVKCFPHTVVGDGDVETKVFLAMASPYPSRNASALHTMFVLKAENDRLQRKVTEYRNRLPSNNLPPSHNAHGGSHTNSIYATSSLHSSIAGSFSGFPQTEMDLGNQHSQYLPQPTATGQFGGLMLGTKERLESINEAVTTTLSNNFDEPLDSEGTARKKMKRAQNAEQYVALWDRRPFATLADFAGPNKCVKSMSQQKVEYL
ncbi:hypothetical protein NLJ89_g3720 [Agrocybe chaxingu]|uniref:PAS domain-containing protein n=1 Tax=Agrocybe chaxingu TaxID=84603 RepID=A0A9W8K9K8_9AGAR|nr:hypothetical protein NLJ89_g3720 [Agrocybe chaxingu]